MLSSLCVDTRLVWSAYKTSGMLQLLTMAYISGYGSEKENLAAEKAFEEAEAKGHRPCPTCKKMIDMSADHIYKAAAFEPTDEELSIYARKLRKEKAQARRRSNTFDMDARMETPSPTGSVIELSDSDASLPDVMTMFKKPSPVRKKGKKSVVYSDDDSADELPSTSKSKAKKGKKKASKDEDSDVEYLGMSPSKRKASGKRKAIGSGDESSGVEVVAVTPSRRKKKARATPDSDEEEEEVKKPTGQEPSDAVLATWRRGDDDMEPSTKMLELVKYLREWDESGDKVICYSQWTSMLDLLDIVLAREGVRTLRFDGKMDRLERDRAIATFKKAGGPKIMLISTKAGSVGLNLVCANRVVNMDLSWNYASESQAYDRVHRIGQEKPVFIKRLVVENTIEERMLRLQDVKTGLAEAALGEGMGGKLHKLSVKDIKYLFGMTKAKPPVGEGSGRNSGPASGRASPF
ncbi:hypothetical protein NMY22_g15987 [Coprinellus aureogranulatus]|nr:hypothetical protein NMY22_g15987 [Coprinellus aureogranulatus]